VLQETLTRALSRRGSYDRARPVLPWLKRIALRTFLDLRARPRPRPVLLEEALEPRAPEGSDTLDQRELVERLLRRLGAREREVLERFHRESQSVREIAEALGVAEGTVKSLLHRARRRLAGGPGEESL
jgi:RNA polymerase sigma-70 factor (ECF subfamily)